MPCLLMFAILCAFDSVFLLEQLGSWTLWWQIANEELCLCLLLFSPTTESLPQSPISLCVSQLT